MTARRGNRGASFLLPDEGAQLPSRARRRRWALAGRRAIWLSNAPLARLRFLPSNEGPILKREIRMPPFRTAVIQKLEDALRRLADFDLNVDQILAIRDTARAASDDASPLMPQNAPGTLAYIHGVGTLRAQILGGEWVIDRTLGVVAVINHRLGLRIGYQNVDRACDALFPPMPRSEKGSGAERLCRLPLFDFYGVLLETDADRLPSDDVKDPHSDQIVTYFVMVGEDGSVELSCPVIANKRYSEFRERIFISGPNDDWKVRIDPENDPIDDFDVPVVFKDRAA